MLKGIVILLISAGLFLIVSNIDIKKIPAKIKAIKANSNQKGRKTRFNSVLESKLDYIEKLIQKSNIRIYVPYSVWTHIFICFVFFFLGVIFMEQYMNIVVSVIFGFGLCTIPFLLLKIITDVLSYKIKRISVDFLIILKNFFVSSKNNDIFDCFKRASEYISDPLKTYINIMIYEHEHKISPIQCLENFKEKIEVSELKLFVENLKICYIHGGDIVALIDTFIEEIGKQNDDEDEESTEDSMLNIGLYFLLLINFAVMYVLMNSAYRQSILEPIWGQIVFSLDIIISIYIVIQSMNKLQT